MTEHESEAHGSLQSLLERARSIGWLAVDTEFIRDKTYYPELCLVQLAVDGQCVVFDPLATPDCPALRGVLDDTSIVKVFHAAEQDIEVFYHTWKSIPAPLFDTQLAAPLLGYREHIGYAHLVQELLGVELSKGQTRTDWAQRPLSDAQRDYALDDVRYLEKIYPMLRDRLVERGRLNWLIEDFARLTDARRYQPMPEQAWRRVKSAGRLKGVRALALHYLAQWREEQAIGLNKPRRWVIGDDALVGIAQALPKHLDGLSRLRGLGEGFLERHGESLLDCIERARQAPKSHWPTEQTVTPRSGPTDEALLDTMNAIVRLVADEHDISASLIASRRDLDALLSEGTGALTLGWRASLIGKRLQDWLDGHSVLSVENDQLVCRRR